MRTKTPKQLSNSISHLLKNMGIEQKIKEHQVLNEWQKIVGKKLADVTTANNVVNGVMFVNVKNSVWRNEIVFLKADIMKKIEEKIGTGIIKEIKFI